MSRSTPPFKTLYKVNQKECEELKNHIHDLMENIYIRLSKSPYEALVLFVHKKDSMLQMCINYYALNKIPMNNKYPLPKIDNLFDYLNGNCYFNQIDLKLK
jgi:hypothetical protein